MELGHYILGLVNQYKGDNQWQHSDMQYLVDHIIHEVSELDTLSPEWIEKHKERGGTYQIQDGEYYIAVKDLESKITLKLEKPNVPKFYAKIKGHERITSVSQRCYWVYRYDNPNVEPYLEVGYKGLAIREPKTIEGWRAIGITEENAEFEQVEETE